MATDIILKNKRDLKIQEPKKYKVVMYNDDFTPMEFVVEILMEIFGKLYDDAINLMMEVHQGTKATVGVYTYDIASTKASQAMARAREEGYPFRVKCEKE